MLFAKRSSAKQLSLENRNEQISCINSWKWIMTILQWKWYRSFCTENQIKQWNQTLIIEQLY